MKRLVVVAILIFIKIGVAGAQSVYQPYSYQFYQKLDPELYSTKTREHTSTLPFFVDDSILKKHYDTLINYGTQSKQNSWGYRKLFDEHCN